MARPITIADPQHRREQAEYRQRLDAKGAPEAPQADTAVTIAVYAVLCEIAQKSPRRGKRAREEFLDRAVALLVAQGYDRAQSMAVLHRRLLRPPARFDGLLGFDPTGWPGLLA